MKSLRSDACSAGENLLDADDDDDDDDIAAALLSLSLSPSLLRNGTREQSILLLFSCFEGERGEEIAGPPGPGLAWSPRHSQLSPHDFF